MKSDREQQIREYNASLYLEKLGELLQVMGEISGIKVGNFYTRPGIEKQILKEHDPQHLLGKRDQLAKEYLPYIEIYNNDQLSAAEKIAKMQEYAQERGGDALGTLTIHSTIYRMDVENKKGFGFDAPDKKLIDANKNLQDLIYIATNVRDAKQSIADHAAQHKAQKSHSARVGSSEQVREQPRVSQSAPAKVEVILSQQEMDIRYGERAQQYLEKIGELLAIISVIPQVEVGSREESKTLKNYDKGQHLGDKEQIAKHYQPYLDIINNHNLSPVQKVEAMKKIAEERIEYQQKHVLLDVVINRIDLTNRGKFHFDPEDKNLKETTNNVDYLIAIATNILHAKEQQKRPPAKANSGPSFSSAKLFQSVSHAQSDPVRGKPDLDVDDKNVTKKAPTRKF